MNREDYQEFRSAIWKLMYYMDQFGVYGEERVDEIEKKIIIQMPPGSTDAQYHVEKAAVRQLIEEMVAKN